MKITLKFFREVGLLTTALTLALLANFVYGAWSNPTAAPTGGNTDAPLNVGNDNQVKGGGLDLGNFLRVTDTVTGKIAHLTNSGNEFVIQQGDVTNGPTVDALTLGNNGTHSYVKADDQVWANEYCDKNGNNCITPPGGSASGGSALPCNFGYTVNPNNGSISCKEKIVNYNITNKQCLAGHNTNCSVSFNLDDYGVVLNDTSKVSFIARYFNGKNASPNNSYPCEYGGSSPYIIDGRTQYGSFGRKGAGVKINYDNNSHSVNMTSVAYGWGGCGGSVCGGCLSDISVSVKSY